VGVNLAKAIAFLAQNDGDISDYIFGNNSIFQKMHNP